MKTVYRMINLLMFGILISGCTGTGHQRERFVDELVQKMTLEEKVGQMTQVDKRMLDSEEDIAK